MYRAISVDDQCDIPSADGGVVLVKARTVSTQDSTTRLPTQGPQRVLEPAADSLQ